MVFRWKFEHPLLRIVWNLDRLHLTHRYVPTLLPLPSFVNNLENRKGLH